MVEFKVWFFTNHILTTFVKEVTWGYSHYYKGNVNLLKMFGFVERLVKYSALDETNKMGRVALT
jgi:hypothetical protein